MGGRFGPGAAPADPQVRQERRLNFMAAYLGLTDAQKEQAAAIFANAAKESEALRPLIQQAQLALRDGAKTNASNIDALAAEVGKLMGQMRAIHARAFGAFYQILTPDQQAKLDQMHDSCEGGCFGLGGGFGRPHHR